MDVQPSVSEQIFQVSDKFPDLVSDHSIWYQSTFLVGSFSRQAGGIVKGTVYRPSFSWEDRAQLSGIVTDCNDEVKGDVDVFIHVV